MEKLTRKEFMEKYPNSKVTHCKDYAKKNERMSVIRQNSCWQKMYGLQLFI